MKLFFHIKLQGIQKISLSLLLFFLTLYCYSQEIDTDEEMVNVDVVNNVLYRKESSGFFMLHTGSWGGGYRKGMHVTGYKKRMFEVEFVEMRHPKEIKIPNPYYENSKSYVYGKLNNFFIIRTGFGTQKIINDKPYWGGVQVRYFYYGGISLGLTKPVYLFITRSDQSIIVERYDPNKHDSDNIYGKASFFKGFGKTNPHPGIYGKFGFNFEYGIYDDKVQALEVGMIVDAYPKEIPMMAFAKNNNVFLSFYFSLHFGKRSN